MKVVDENPDFDEYTTDIFDAAFKMFINMRTAPRGPKAELVSEMAMLEPNRRGAAEDPHRFKKGTHAKSVQQKKDNAARKEDGGASAARAFKRTSVKQGARKKGDDSDDGSDDDSCRHSDDNSDGSIEMDREYEAMGGRISAAAAAAAKPVKGVGMKSRGGRKEDRGPPNLTLYVFFNFTQPFQRYVLQLLQDRNVMRHLKAEFPDVDFESAKGSGVTREEFAAVTRRGSGSLAQVRASLVFAQVWSCLVSSLVYCSCVCGTALLIALILSLVRSPRVKLPTARGRLTQHYWRCSDDWVSGIHWIRDRL